MSHETIRFELDEGVGRLTLNRPDRLNGMTNRMIRETYELLAEVSEREDLRVLVLTGAGKGFCPGADLKHFSEGGEDDTLSAQHFHVSRLLHEMPAVTIAAVNGACAGAGFGWACGCDLRFAAASAVFNTAFLDVASAGDMGGPWTLPRLVGAAKARELYFLPGKFSAEEAQAMGLVARVFADEHFREEVDAVVTRLAAASPEALVTMKRNFVDAERLDFKGYLDLESERHMRVMAGDDPKEAFRAFLEKRPPRFKA